MVLATQSCSSKEASSEPMQQPHTLDGILDYGSTLFKNSTPQDEILGMDFLILGVGILDFWGTLFKNSSAQDEILRSGFLF